MNIETDTVWTPAAIELLLKLRETGMAYRLVAGEMNARLGVAHFTKNSCIGKAWSLQQPEKKHKRKPYKKREVQVDKHVRVDAVIPPKQRRRRPGEPITIYQLRNNDCRWPLGEPLARPPFLYCGCPAPEGEPYCPDHHARAHTISSQPRRTTTP